jgi:ssDNA-binding Zn-finger/Zn-ribbon topoisomerase 1
MITVVCPSCKSPMDIEENEPNTAWECPECAVAFRVQDSGDGKLRFVLMDQSKSTSILETAPGMPQTAHQTTGILQIFDESSLDEELWIKQQRLQCKHCGRGQFTHRTAQLNTVFMEFLDMGWLNKSADIYVCTHCGLLHWFLDPEEGQQIPTQNPGTEVEREQAASEEVPTEDDLAEATECLECHQTIPAGTAKCPACGWSYK